MQLNTSRFFSDRLIFDETSPSKFRVVEGFWGWFQRIVSWIYSPRQYSEENRRTVACFHRYLTQTLGENRLKRISLRYGLDWESMKESPLLSRDVAKIFIGAKCVGVEDINELGLGDFSQLSAQTLQEEIGRLSSPFDEMWRVDRIAKKISGGPSQWLARVFYDPLLLDREKLELMGTHPQNSFENFMHSMVARVIKRELHVGDLVNAPNHPDGRAQFYYVSGQLVTGKGMVSYIFHPAGNDTNLEPMRLFRGTSLRNSELDALSTVVTDLEPNLGMSAYRSGALFEPLIREILGEVRIEGGHSMGSTVVQHRLVEMDHIREAHLYSGPGVKEEELREFNRKNPKVRLVIRAASNDVLHQLGQMHLGYQAPSNVHVDFVRYRPTRAVGGTHPHVAMWAQEPAYFAREEVSSEIRDHHLSYKGNLKEYCRSFFGPFVSAIVACVRDIIRFLFTCRIHAENGLKIGRMEGDRWRVDHFRLV